MTQIPDKCPECDEHIVTWRSAVAFEDIDPAGPPVYTDDGTPMTEDFPEYVQIECREFYPCGHVFKYESIEDFFDAVRHGRTMMDHYMLSSGDQSIQRKLDAAARNIHFWYNRIERAESAETEVNDDDQ